MGNYRKTAGGAFWWLVGLKYAQLALVHNVFSSLGWINVSLHRESAGKIRSGLIFLHRLLVPVRLNCFCCRADWGEGCRGEGGVALLGRGGAGEEGVEEVVDEGLLLESGWYGTEMWSWGETEAVRKRALITEAPRSAWLSASSCTHPLLSWLIFLPSGQRLGFRSFWYENESSRDWELRKKVIHHDERDSQFTLWTKVMLRCWRAAVIFKTSTKSAQKEVLVWLYTSFKIHIPYLAFD